MLTDRFRRLVISRHLIAFGLQTTRPYGFVGIRALPFIIGERCLWTPVLISEDVEVMLEID